MAKDFSKRFYSSKAWQDCRNSYAASKAHLCERCLLKGLYVPGEIVHHKTELTPENIGDPRISLSWDNLELVCRECHAEAHSEHDKGRRYIFDEDGHVLVKNFR